jgi:hypothetical protein
MTIDFSTADEQGKLIPDNTIVAVTMAVTRGGEGPDGWLTKSKAGDSLGLDAKLVVIDGPFKGSTIFYRFTLMGQSEGQKKAAQISASTLRAILESA